MWFAGAICGCFPGVWWIGKLRAGWLLNSFCVSGWASGRGFGGDTHGTAAVASSRAAALRRAPGTAFTPVRVVVGAITVSCAAPVGRLNRKQSEGATHRGFVTAPSGQ